MVICSIGILDGEESNRKLKIETEIYKPRRNEVMKKRKVLVMVDWYAPGFKAGGPIRSAVNFANQLEQDLDIYILTSDRDLGELKPYVDIIADNWIAVNQHHVFYASPAFLSWSKLQQIIKDINADYIYLNSMYSRFFSIYPLLMNRLGKLNSKIVLAPRGMLKESAIQHKGAKKKIFISLFKSLGMPAKVIFHATDDTEVKDIVSQFGNKILLFKAGNLPGKQETFIAPGSKIPGELNMIFVGRIHPIKNLEFLLQALKKIKEKVALTVIATLEDALYWQKCQTTIKSLPNNISVELLQDIPHEKIASIIREHHIFALPTRGENFGHSIFEALAVGRPVLISDQTPWQNLESKNAGWVLSLSDKEKFADIIHLAANMEHSMLAEWCKGAWTYANTYLQNSSLKQSYLKQFC